MNANFINNFFLSSSVVLYFLAFSLNAYAIDTSYSKGSKVGPRGKISEIGLEHNLELYKFDEADSCVDNSTQIRTLITNLSKSGIVKVELFGKKNFMKKSGKLRRIRVPADSERVSLCINVPAPGEYALVSYHDKDGNRKLKKAWNLKPKEPYGVSNNPVIESLRLPRWAEASFYVPQEGIEVVINLVKP